VSGVVNKLWGFCATLRHDGIGYGDYIEQLTYLLLLKVAGEKDVDLPAGCGWDSLRQKSGNDLLGSYSEVLKTLSTQGGVLGDIFAGSRSRFREPANLKRLIVMIDETPWSALDVDITADAYEGLLQKYASDQKGAGQYFTPRAVIRMVVRCVRPDIREKADFTLHDPAAGTAGFLVGAYEWIMDQTTGGALLSRSQRERLRSRTFSGGELVQDARRLGLMNLFLHGISADLNCSDSLAEPHQSRRYDVVLTNPPFGSKGSGEAPDRADFAVRTANRQLNFLQHVISILKPGGRAAVVLPDNVLFSENAGRVMKVLTTRCELHTLLRLPNGTFTPYSSGVKANVLFFRKGPPTKETWMYDLRTGAERVTIRRPLSAAHFRDFEECYNSKPRKETERFRRFTIEQIKERDFDLNIVWLKDAPYDDRDEPSEPSELVSEALVHLQTAVHSLNELSRRLGEEGVSEIGA
jgi:type I restriction enzyme M protein